MKASAIVAALGLLGGATPAAANPPLSYLRTFGPAADPATQLSWGAMVVSIAVSVIIGLLVLVGVWRRSATRDALLIGQVPIERRGGGVRWIWIGVTLTSLVLLATLVWTLAALAAMVSPAPELTIAVTGRQWWWQAAYQPDNPSQRFVTANELHIPVGRPVRIELLSSDVIHSFWVPALAGKTDAIPGRLNVAWLQADQPGRYLGQCTEYCGRQHAHMAFLVIAQPPAEFAAWLRAQRALAQPPGTPEQAEGLRIFVKRCGDCHAVRGTAAHGSAAPDLTHLMSRRTIAAGALANTPGGLSGWIANPQGVKPGAHMPPPYLSGPELSAVRAYLLNLS